MLFADEPTGNLDSRTGGEVIDLLLGLVKEYGTTLLAVTHDTDLAARGDRVLHIRDGALDED
jgi:putative ABC transport system ATP-binding protein